MPIYRFYCIGKDDQVLMRRDDCAAEDDAGAVDHALPLCGDGYGVEIWEGARFVVRLNKDGSFRLERGA
jgi:hypothetical protein